MKRILFIGHDASRSGAPLILLHLINWLKVNDPKVVIDLLLLRGGELESSYGESANVYVLLNDKDASLFRRGIAHLKGEYFGARKLRTANIPPFKRTYDAVLGNTVITLEYLELFKKKGFRTICWLHELEYVVSLFYSHERFVRLSERVDCFIAGSKAVDAMLTDFGCKTPSQVVYEFLPNEAVAAIETAAVRAELGIPNNAFIVGGGGTVEWRKGTDLFLQIASRVTKNNPDIYFVWIGGRPDHHDSEFERVQHDLKHLDLEGKVIFSGITDEPQRFFSAIDLFILTSREDSFPLMCIDAALFEKPIICFQNAGGMPEFVEDDCGFVVPYLDIEAAANTIIKLCDEPELRVRLGSAATKKSRQRHDITIAAPKILKIIQDVAADVS